MTPLAQGFLLPRSRNHTIRECSGAVRRGGEGARAQLYFIQPVQLTRAESKAALLIAVGNADLCLLYIFSNITDDTV